MLVDPSKFRRNTRSVDWRNHRMHDHPIVELPYSAHVMYQPRVIAICAEITSYIY